MRFVLPRSDNKWPQVLAGLLAAGWMGCAPPGPDEPEGTDEGSRDAQDGIIGGTPATAYPESVLINMRRQGSVVSSCSGSVVSPRVVLTAGHCVTGYDGWDVVAPHAGWQAASSTEAEVYDYTNQGNYVAADQHDVGLVFLPQGSAIDLAAYPLLASQKAANGTQAVNVGRIDDGSFSSSSLFVSPPVSLYDAASWGFPFDYRSDEVIQSGDSGGPVMLTGAAPHTIVAVNSGAGNGWQVLARVDLVATWISARIDEHPAADAPQAEPEPPPADDPCGGVSYEGECQGNTVVWCEGGALESIACGTKSCGWDAAHDFYNCL